MKKSILAIKYSPGRENKKTAVRNFTAVISTFSSKDVATKYSALGKGKSKK